MTALRKGRARNGTYVPPAEAFDYDADVTPEAIAIVRESAKKAREDDELEVVEGYVGTKRK